MFRCDLWTCGLSRFPVSAVVMVGPFVSAWLALPVQTFDIFPAKPHLAGWRIVRLEMAGFRPAQDGAGVNGQPFRHLSRCHPFRRA